MWRAFRAYGIWSLAALLQATPAWATVPLPAEAGKVFVPLSLEKHILRWDGLFVGMSLRQLDQVLGVQAATPNVQHVNLCGGFTVRRVLHGVALDIDLIGPPSEETVAGIFIHWQGATAALTARELVPALRRAVADLVYRPSLHAPELAEQDNPMPLFQLKDAVGMVIFLKPGEGFYLGMAACLG